MSETREMSDIALTAARLGEAMRAHTDATREVLRELGTTRRALALACERISDGPQQYHEANTPEGWAEVYLTQAQAIAEKAHLGDPCIFCHKPHDEVGVGDCEGHRHPEACTCERCGQAWLAANYERE